MMDYKAYERKMNSIYDMVGEGKYKVRTRRDFELGVVERRLVLEVNPPIVGCPGPSWDK
jgi:hypothetical protein